MDFLEKIFPLILQFEFYYPLFMAYIWIIGGLYYHFRWEQGSYRNIEQLPTLKEYPGVSIIVPCYNEADNILETMHWLARQKYPNYEIIAVNDGSSDGTAKMLDDLVDVYPRLRVIHLSRNQGKAVALRAGTLLSKNEFLVCIDGDALLDENATYWLMKHFSEGPRVGAITGNPRVRTRSTLLGKIQVGEFSAIVGLIKRAQRVYGRIFTVSGVVVAFRKSALHRVGYWGIDMITDDIDISWKLQLNHWDIRFEPNALCWILMPEKLAGLWKQRLRWAQGGVEVLIRYFPELFKWRSRRMWGVYIEFITSVVWSYFMAAILIIWLLSFIIVLPEAIAVKTMIPGWNGVVLGLTCLLQFAVSMFIDSRFEKGLGRIYYWMIWYPLAYWVLNIMTTICAAPIALFKRRGKRAKWTSPDRGLQS